MWPLGSAENSETSTLESLGEAWRPRACREAREGELGAREGQLGAQGGQLGAQEGQLGPKGAEAVLSAGQPGLGTAAGTGR